MKLFEKVALIKNICSSWLGLVVNVATGIIISPFILHRLGEEAFGLWVLVFSITGYYGLFDFGIRSSLVKYVAKFEATGDQEELSHIINTSLFSYSCACLVLLALTTVGAAFLDKVIHVQHGYVTTAKILFFMVGAALALGFPLAVFGGVLEGLQKFYLINAINIINTILRAVFIVIALNQGYGLLMAAFITAVLPLINGLVNAFNALRLTKVPIALHFVTKDTFKRIFSYGSVTFMFSLARNLRFKTDALVIGTFLSAAAITPFAIGGRIVDYMNNLVDSMAQVFTPMSSHFEAKGDIDRLRSIYIGGNRACALVVFPVCFGLIILGKSVIEVWMGAKYIAASYPVLLVLLIPSTIRMAQATSSRVLFGMARHKVLAVVVLLEGVANLVLSIILVRPYGIVGDAVGTAIPLLFTYVVFLPRHLSIVLGQSIRTFLVKAYTVPLLLCLPMIAVLLALQRWFVPHTLVQLCIHTLLGGSVYAAFVYYFMFVKGPLRHVRAEPAKPQEDVSTEVEPAAVSYQEEA